MNLDEHTRAASPFRRRRRILYIHPDTVGFDPDPRKSPLLHLSGDFEGDYLAIWWVEREDRARREGEIRNVMGDFEFHWTQCYRLPPILRQLWGLFFYVGTGLALSIRKGRYDVIFVYGPYGTGMAGYVLKLLSGTPLILEIPGHPTRALDFGKGGIAKLKQRLAPWFVSFLTRRADHLRLRYPTQLGDSTPPDPSRVTVFPNFVPVSTIAENAARLAERQNAASQAPPYILFMGYPWNLKGVDILIEAFNRIWCDFPEVKLKIVGFCPDRSSYEGLAEGNPNIEFSGPLAHDVAMELMAGCQIFVLPSRTEAMARVLVEAMAAGRPIIASAVDGLPFYIEHGVRGLLFDSENVEQLAERMATLLCDPGAAEALGRNAHAYAVTRLSESEYVRQFRAMVEATIKRRS